MLLRRGGDNLSFDFAYFIVRILLEAKAAAAVLVSTPNLTNTCSRCLLTVRGLEPRMSPISRLVLPLVAQYKTSDSRLVNLNIVINASICAASDSSRSKITHCSLSLSSAGIKFKRPLGKTIVKSGMSACVSRASDTFSIQDNTCGGVLD
jgi:hypothetical protein